MSVQQQKAPEAIFKAYDIRGIVGQTLTDEIVYELGRAIGSEARSSGQKEIVIARDGRLSGPAFSAALSRGLQDSGLDVTDLGQVPTPVLYFAAHVHGTGTGVMVTGSHNPPDYNGFKMMIAGDTLAGEQIQRLRQRIISADFESGQGRYQALDLGQQYIDRICADIKLVRPMKIVVDSGNGVAGELAPRLLRALGCEVIELFCEIDGHFPNHHPDPSQHENLVDLIAAVAQQQADIGLAFDGDGDRLGVIDEQGQVIWPDRQIMLFAEDIIARHPGGEILYDVKCSRHLARVITDVGGTPIMWQTGHSLIKARMRESDVLLAGEMSGHIFFKERWYGFDDALYTAARLLEIVAARMQSVSAIFAALPNAISTPELRLTLPEGEHFKFMARFSRDANFPDAEVITIDGLRVEFKDGWGLVRASNTTPSLILRFEADNETALERIKERFRQAMLAVDATLELGF